MPLPPTAYTMPRTHLYPFPVPPAPASTPLYIGRERLTPAPSFNLINFIDPSINPQGLELQQNTQAMPISLFRTILNLKYLKKIVT